ncbi:TetR/AcrR family transcriptional regulator [Cupriavidus pauculus]|uniref:TetR/AcrR family transcriptional regulator n=1 Tax=Cupriavidus pauculus TaxID=82633 RepID=UPI001EE2FB78|nr:TetR/AcrR family transcriptional regulator [Cupriavidus pauculus]GJG97943.1 TetR/AcrR family transcriptional regulator [Cupriavidus pauculus]
MARASRAVADQHRTAIEEASARLFRQHGLHGVTVAQVMASAGLTHGGFYNHFASKDELVAIGCARAFSDAAVRWEQKITQHGDDRHAARRQLMEHYLSEAHRDAPENGCPASALAGDVAREPAGKPVRQAYLDGIGQLLTAWKPLALPEDDDADAGTTHRTALVELATLVGAILLARATAGDAISDDILAAARVWLLETESHAVPAA